ncbi:hypothetical protein EGW08_017245, partial [Elysia chlorotica]
AIGIRVIAVRDGGGLTVDLHVLPQGAWVRVALVAALDLAVVRLVAGVDVAVLLAVRAVGEAAVAAIELTLERLLAWSGIDPLVDLEVLGAGEDFATAGERARERLLARVHPHVVDQLVLGLEGASVPRAALPVAGVVSLLGPAHMLHRDVRDDLVHGREEFVAGLLGLGLVLVHPQARVLLFDWVPHERVECACAGRPHVHGV